MYLISNQGLLQPDAGEAATFWQLSLEPIKYFLFLFLYRNLYNFYVNISEQKKNYCFHAAQGRKLTLIHYKYLYLPIIKYQNT